MIEGLWNLCNFISNIVIQTLDKFENVDFNRKILGDLVIGLKFQWIKCSILETCLVKIFFFWIFNFVNVKSELPCHLPWAWYTIDSKIPFFICRFFGKIHKNNKFSNICPHSTSIFWNLLIKLRKTVSIKHFFV